MPADALPSAKKGIHVLIRPAAVADRVDLKAQVHPNNSPLHPLHRFGTRSMDESRKRGRPKKASVDYIHDLGDDEHDEDKATQSHVRKKTISEEARERHRYCVCLPCCDTDKYTNHPHNHPNGTFNPHTQSIQPPRGATRTRQGQGGG